MSWTVLVGCVLALVGCDVSSPEDDHPSRGLDLPAPRVLGVEATVDYVDGQPVRAALEEGSVAPAISRSASFRIRFDRFLLPVSVLRQSICLRPAVDPVETSEACRDPVQAFTRPTYDPFERTVTFRLTTGARLLPQTRYRLTLFPANEEGTSGFQSFDRVPLDRTYSFELETLPEGGPERDEIAPSPISYCAAIDCFEGCAGDPVCEQGCRATCLEPSCFNEGQLFVPFSPVPTATFARCSGGRCHGPVDPFAPTPNVGSVAMGLDLISTEGLRATALGEVAHQTQQGEGALEGEVNPRRFGRSMPRIDPENPGNSYLLYKLIANPLNHPRPGGILDPDLAAELERLRASVVAGLPMPARSDATPGALSPQDDPDGAASAARMRALSTWIAAGALLECPP